MKKTLILLLLFVFYLSVFAQEFTYKWSRVEMNDSWGKDSLASIGVIIDKYSPGMKPLMVVVAHSSEEITKRSPESGLSNLAADIIADAALPFVDEDDKVVSITNFGGIRSNLPSGDIRIYDVYSVFPFENKIVVVDILGRDLKKIYDRFAKYDYFEAVGGVRLVIDGKKILEYEIGGEPLDENKTYKLSTIDFLLEDGDGMRIKEYAKAVLETDILLRDAVVEYMRKKTGCIFSNKTDNRLNFK